MKQKSLFCMKILISFLVVWITVSNAQVDYNNRASGSVGSSYFFYQNPEYPRDCEEAYAQCSATNASGVYLVKPDGYPEVFEVYCENSKDGGGWTVIQRRVDGSLDFNRGWKEYKDGFGFLNSEFWLGSEKLSFLTNQKKYQLRIDMENAVGSSFYLQYNDFRISDEWSDFRVTEVGQYSGTVDNATVFCPANMEYGNCTCQASCEDPENVLGCQTTCTEEEMCICREGFLKEGEDCIPPEACSCYMEGEGVVAIGQTRVNDNCSTLCQCQSNQLTCDYNYGCSPDATCEERDGVRQCYCNDGYTGDGQNCEVIATDCADIYNAGFNDSGIYTIKPTDWPKPPFGVYCNMTDGGGWTVFQRRVDGSQDFYLGWNRYKEGFGSPNLEFWLGNDKLFYITNQKNYQIRIDLINRDGSPYYAKYDLFRINNKDDNYRLVELGTHSGTAGNSFNMKNKQFSTPDVDNDEWDSYDCAERHRGAWWYGEDNFYPSNSNCRTHDSYCELWPQGSGCGECTDSNLNGDYNGGTRGSNIHWETLGGYDCSIKYTEMKIKPV